ncbi:MAG: PepSY-associated TM helix domain-containing protein [Sphingomonas sp.]
MATLSPAHHRAIWRWHFYVGLFVAPVLIILAATGSLYLFDREIEGWWNAAYARVEPGERVAPLLVQERAVRTAFPKAAIRQVRVPHSPSEASEWGIGLPDDSARKVYVDPYRARVTGSVDPAYQPLDIAWRLHAGLMLEPWGRYVVELAACWTLAMIISGIVLWWPRTWQISGVFVPRLDARGRLLWRDLHAVPSVIVALFLGFLVLSGLPWSVFWGDQLARVGQTIPFIAPSPNFGAPAPQPAAAASTPVRMVGPHADHKAEAGIPWTIRHSTPPAGSGARAVGIAEVEALLPMLDQQSWGPGIRIFYPRGANGIFMINFLPDKAEGQRTIYVDPGNGRVIGDVAWADYSPAAKAIEWGVMTHLGRQFGLANQLVNLAFCLAIIGAVIAGLTAWWKRRTPGTLGIPPRQAGDRLPLPLIATGLVLALLFPLVGASLVAVGAIALMQRGLTRGAAR